MSPINTTPESLWEAKAVEDVYCSLSQAKAGHGGPGFVFWDTRSRAGYEGKTPAGAGPQPRPERAETAPAGFNPVTGTWSKPGHIPGAVHLEWIEQLDPDT